MEESANNLSKQRRRRRILMHSDDEDDGTPSKIQSRLLQSEPTVTMLSEPESSPLTEHTVSSFSSTEKSESTSATKQTFVSSSHVRKQETNYESFSKSESSKVESYSDFTKTESSYSSYRRTEESSSVKKSYSSDGGLPDNLPGLRNIDETKGISRNLKEAKSIESSHPKLGQNGKNENTSSSFDSYHDFGKIHRDDKDVSIVDTGKSRTYHETSVKEGHSETFDKNSNEKRRFRTDLEKYSYSDKENTQVDYNRSEHHEVTERRGFVASKDILDRSHRSRDTRDGKHVQHSIVCDPADDSLPVETHGKLDEQPSGNLEKAISHNTEEEKSPNISQNVQSNQREDVSEIHVASIRDRVRLMRASMTNRFYGAEDGESDDEAVTDIRFSSDDETDGLAQESQTVTTQEQPEQFTEKIELPDDVTLFEQNTVPVTTSLKRDYAETQPFDLQISVKQMKRENKDESSGAAHVERLAEEASAENLLVQLDSDEELNTKSTEEGILDLEEQPILTHKADEFTQQDLVNIVHAQVSTIHEFSEQGASSEESHLAGTDATDITGGNQVEEHSTNGIYSVSADTDVTKNEQNKNEDSDNDWSKQEDSATQLVKNDEETPETASLEGDMATTETQLSDVEIVTEKDVRPNKFESQHETPAKPIDTDESFTETGLSKYSDEIQVMETDIFETKTMATGVGEIQSMETKTEHERPEREIDSGNNLSQQPTSKFTRETETDISGVYILRQGNEDEIQLTDSNVNDELPAMEVGVSMTSQAIASKTEPMVDDNVLQDPQQSQQAYVNEDNIQQDDQTRLQAVPELNNNEDRITLKDNKKPAREIAFPPSDFINPPTKVGSATMDTDLNNSGVAIETEVLIKSGELTTDSSQSEKLEHPQRMVGSDEVIIVHGNAVSEPNIGDMIIPSHDKLSYEVEKRKIRTYERRTYQTIETLPNEQTSPEKLSPEARQTLSYEVKRHEVRPTETTFSKLSSSKKLDLLSYAPRPYKKVEQKTQQYQAEPRVKEPYEKPTLETERQEMRFYHLKSIEQPQDIQPPTKTEDDEKTYESSAQERSDGTSLYISKLTEIQPKVKLDAGMPCETSTQKGPDQLTLYDSQAMNVWSQSKRQDDRLGKLHPTASYHVESHEIRSFKPMALESQPNDELPSLLEYPTNLPAEAPPQSKSEGIRQPQDTSVNDKNLSKLSPCDPQMTGVTSENKKDETEDSLFHTDRYDKVTREIKSFKTTFHESVPHDAQHSETQYIETQDDKVQSEDENVQLRELQYVERQDAKVESKERKDVKPGDDFQHTYDMESRKITSYKTTLYESPAHNVSPSKEMSPPERDLRYTLSKVRPIDYTSYESALRELQPNDVQLQEKQPYDEQPHEPQPHRPETDESSSVDSMDGVEQYDDQTQDIMKQKQEKRKNEPYDADPNYPFHFQPYESSTYECPAEMPKERAKWQNHELEVISPQEKRDEDIESGPMGNVPDHKAMPQQGIPDEDGLQYVERIEPPTVHTPEIRSLEATLHPAASDLEPELIDEHENYAPHSSYAIPNSETTETVPERYSVHTSTEYRRHYRDTSSPVLQQEEFEDKKREYVASDDEESFETYEPILVLGDLPEDTNTAPGDYGPLKDEDIYSHQKITQLDSSPQIPKRKHPEETDEDETDSPEHVAIKRKIRVVTSNQIGKQETRTERSSYSNKTTFRTPAKENIPPTSQHTTNTNTVTETISSSTRNALESSNESMDNIFNMMEIQATDSSEQLPKRLPQSLEKYPCDTEVEKFAKPTDPLRKYRVDIHIQLSPVERLESRTKPLKSWKSEPILNVKRRKERRSKSMDLEKKLPMQSSVVIELKKPQRRPLAPAYTIENLPFETVIRNEVSIKLKKKRRNTFPSGKIKEDLYDFEQDETHNSQLSEIEMKEIERRDVHLSESFETVDPFYTEHFNDEHEDNNKENQPGDDVSMENADESPLKRRNDESVSVDQEPRTSWINVAPITIRPKTFQEQPTYVEVKQGHGSDITFGRIESVPSYEVHHGISSEKPRDDIIIEETSSESVGFPKQQTREDGAFKEKTNDHSKEDFVEPKDEDQRQEDSVLQGHASIRDQAELSTLHTLRKPKKSTNRRQRIVIDRKLLEEAVKHEEPSISPVKENSSLEHEPVSPNENRSVEHAVRVEKYLDNDSNNNVPKELHQQYLLSHPKKGTSHSEGQDGSKRPQDFFEVLNEFKPSLETDDGRTHYDTIDDLPSKTESVSSINIGKYLENIVENKVEEKSEIDGVTELEPYEPYDANKEIQMLMGKISSDEEEPVKPLVPQQAIEVILIDETKKKKKKKKKKKQLDSDVNVIFDLVDKPADDQSIKMRKPASVETKPEKKEQVDTKEIAVQTMFLPDDMDSEEDSDLEILQYLPRSFVNTIPHRGLLFRDTQDDEPTPIHPHQKKPAYIEPAITDSQFSQENEKDVTTTFSHPSFTIENFLSENSDKKTKPWPTEISGAEQDVPRSIYPYQPEHDKVGFEFDTPTESREGSPNSATEYESSKVTYKPRFDVQDFVQEDQRRQNGAVVHGPPIKKHRMSSPHSPTNNTFLESSEFRKKEPIIDSKSLEVSESAKPSRQHSYELHAFIKEEVKDGGDPNQPSRTKVLEEDAGQGENRFQDRDMEEVDSGLDALTAYEPRYNRRPNKPKRTSVPPASLIKNVNNEQQEKDSRATLPEYEPRYKVGYFKVEEEPTMDRLTEEPNSCTEHPAEQKKTEITRPKYEPRLELMDLILKEDRKIKENPSYLVPLQNMETPTVPVVHDKPGQLAGPTPRNELKVFASEEQPQVNFPKVDTFPNDQIRVSLFEAPERQPIYATRTNKSLDVSIKYKDDPTSSFHQPRNEIKNFVLQGEPNAVKENNDNEKLKTEEYCKKLEPDHATPSIKDDVLDNEPSRKNTPFLENSMIETHKTPLVEEEPQQTNKAWEPRNEIRAFVVEEEPKTTVNGKPTLPHENTATLPVPAESSYEPKHWIKNFVDEKFEDKKEPRKAFYNTSLPTYQTKYIIPSEMEENDSDFKKDITYSLRAEQEPALKQHERHPKLNIHSFVLEEQPESKTEPEVPKSDIGTEASSLPSIQRNPKSAKYITNDLLVIEGPEEQQLQYPELEESTNVSAVSFVENELEPIKTASNIRPLSHLKIEKEPVRNKRAQMTPSNNKVDVTAEKEVQKDHKVYQSIPQQKYENGNLVTEESGSKDNTEPSRLEDERKEYRSNTLEIRNFVRDKHPVNQTTTNEALVPDEKTGIIVDPTIKELSKEVSGQYFSVAQPRKIHEFVLEEESDKPEKTQESEFDENLTSTVDTVKKEPDVPQSPYQRKHEVRGFVVDKSPANKAKTENFTIINESADIIQESTVKEIPDGNFGVSQSRQIREFVLEEETKWKDKPQKLEVDETLRATTSDKVHREPYAPRSPTQPKYEIRYFVGAKHQPLRETAAEDVLVTDEKVVSQSRKIQEFVLEEEPDRKDIPQTLEVDENLTRSTTSEVHQEPDVPKSPTQRKHEISDFVFDKYPVDKAMANKASGINESVIIIEDPTNKEHPQPVFAVSQPIKIKEIVIEEELVTKDKPQTPESDGNLTTTTINEVRKEPELTRSHFEPTYEMNDFMFNDEPNIGRQFTPLPVQKVDVTVETMIKETPNDNMKDSVLDKKTKTKTPQAEINLHEPDFTRTVYRPEFDMPVLEEPEIFTQSVYKTKYEINDFVSNDKPERKSLPEDGSTISVPSPEQTRPGETTASADESEVADDISQDKDEELTRLDIDPYPSSSEDNLHQPTTFAVAGTLALEDSTDGPKKLNIDLVNEHDETKLSPGYIGPADPPAVNIPETVIVEHDVEKEPVVVNFVDNTPKHIEKKEVRDAGVPATTTENEKTKEKSVLISPTQTRARIAVVLVDNEQDHVTTEITETSVTGMPSQLIKKSSLREVESRATTVTKTEEKEDEPTIKRIEDPGIFTTIDEMSELTDESSQGEDDELTRLDIDTSVERSTNEDTDFLNTLRTSSPKRGIEEQTTIIIEEEYTREKKVSPLQSFDKEENRPQTGDQKEPDNLDHATNSQLYSPEDEAHPHQKSERETVVETSPAVGDGYNYYETIETKTPSELNEEQTEFLRTDSQHQQQKAGESVSTSSPQKTGRITVVLLDDESEQKTKENTTTFVPLVEQARYDETPDDFFELTDQFSEEDEELTRLDFDPYPLTLDEPVYQPLRSDVEDIPKLENSYTITDTTDGSGKVAIDFVNENDKSMTKAIGISAVSIPEIAIVEHDVEQEPVEVDFVENAPEQIGKKEVRNFDISSTTESNQKMNESVSTSQLRANERITVVLADDEKDLVSTNIAETPVVSMQSQLIKKRSIREVETVATTLGKTEATAPEPTTLGDGDTKHTMNNATFDEADDQRGTNIFMMNGRPVQIDPDEPRFTGTAVIERLADDHHTESTNRTIHTTTYTSAKSKNYESDGTTAAENVPEVAEQKFVRDSNASTFAIDDKPKSVEGTVSFNVMENSENAIDYEHKEDGENHNDFENETTYSYLRQLDPQAVVIVDTPAVEQSISTLSANKEYYELETPESTSETVKPKYITKTDVPTFNVDGQSELLPKTTVSLNLVEESAEDASVITGTPDDSETVASLTVRKFDYDQEDIYARVNKEKLGIREQREETLKREVKASGNHVCIDHQPGATTIAVAEKNLAPDLEEKTIVKDIKITEDKSEVVKQKFLRNTETQHLEHPPQSNTESALHFETENEDVVWMTVRHSKKLFNSSDSVRMITLPIVNILPSDELSPTDDIDLDWLTEQSKGEASRAFSESTHTKGKGGEMSSSDRFLEESLLVREHGEGPKHESMGTDLFESKDTESEQAGLFSRIITEDTVSNEKEVVEDTENIVTRKSVREIERSPDQYMIDENEAESWISEKEERARTSSSSKVATSEVISGASYSQVVESEEISQQSGKETVTAIDNMAPDTDVWCTVKMKRWESDIRKENRSKQFRGTESASELSSSTASVDGSYDGHSRVHSLNSEFSVRSEQFGTDPWISVRRKSQNIGDASTLSIKSSKNGTTVKRSSSSGTTDRGGSNGYSIQITATNDGPLMSQEDTLSSTYSHEAESSQGTDAGNMTTLPWIEVRQRNSTKHRLSWKKKKREGTLKGVPHTTDGKDRLLLVKVPRRLLMEIENDENVLETEVEIPWMELDPSSAGDVQGYLPWVELADQVQNTQSDRILMLKISREMILKASQSSTNEESEIQLPWNEVVKYWEETGQITPGSLAHGEKAANIAITFSSQSESEILEENLNLPDMRLILPKKYCLESSLNFKPTITVNEKRNIKVRINKSMKRKHDWNTLLRLSKSERRKKYSYVIGQNDWAVLADGTKWWRLQVDDMDEFSQVRPRSDGQKFKNYFEISSEERDGKDSIDFNEFTKELGNKKQKQFSFVIDPRNLLTSTMSF